MLLSSHLKSHDQTVLDIDFHQNLLATSNMASSKRQKTGLRDSGVFLDSDSDGTTASSPRLHKGRNVLGETSGNDRTKRTSPTSSEKRKESDKAAVESVDSDKGEDPYRYICFHRPFFDVDGENWRAWSDGKAERLDRGDLARQIYKPGFEKEKAEGIVDPRTPAKEHPGHKWVIMRDAWVKFDLLSRKGKYCDPFSFGAELLSNHWHGYGMQEVVENAVCTDRNCVDVVLMMSSWWSLIRLSRRRILTRCGR